MFHKLISLYKDIGNMDKLKKNRSNPLSIICSPDVNTENIWGKYLCVYFYLFVLNKGWIILSTLLCGLLFPEKYILKKNYSVHEKCQGNTELASS